MEVINDNKCVAQGAAAWQEKETREQVMRDLESVHGYVDSYFQINGYVYVWAIQELPHTRAIEIAERGNHDEIMFMIHQYGKANVRRRKEAFCGRFAIVFCRRKYRLSLRSEIIPRK